MAFDALVLAAVADELRNYILNCRIKKIHQPSKTEIIFKLYKPGRNFNLLFSVHPMFSRVHLTQYNFANPKNPFPFCMLLRKYLTGGQITRIEQPSSERILNIYIGVIDSRGEKTEKILVAEIMGRYSNLILNNQADQPVILGALKYVSSEMSRVRIIKPNKEYFPPPSQQKLNPLSVSFDHFKKQFGSLNNSSRKSLEKFIIDSFFGISPLIAREIMHRSNITLLPGKLSDKNILLIWENFEHVMSTLKNKNFEPTLVKEKDNYVDLAAINLIQFSSSKIEKISSISAAIDKYYHEKEIIEQQKELYHVLKKKSIRTLKRTKKKKERQLKELQNTEDAEIFRKWGELILAQLSSIPNKAKEAILTDLYNGGQITIPLNPKISPPANAQYYFQKYHKYKKSKHKILSRLNQTQNEILYLESVLFNVDKADLQVLQEIKEELHHAGYISKEYIYKTKHPSKITKASKPLKFVSSDGYIFYAGRNNHQNDFLTMKKSRSKDLWLHAKDTPGAHVIIEGENPPSQTIKEAAMIAAYYSRAVNSSNVPVDFTLIRYVRKLPHAKAGMVIYSNHRTIYVTPKQELVNRLKREN